MKPVLLSEILLFMGHPIHSQFLQLGCTLRHQGFLLLWDATSFAAISAHIGGYSELIYVYPRTYNFHKVLHFLPFSH